MSSANATAYFNQQVALVDSLLVKLKVYKDPQRIRTDVVDLIKRFPSLQPRSGAQVNTNSPNQILFLTGTIPIFYNGAQYNIPVAIWVVETYPYSPPVAYVTPTSDMIIKPRHRHVDSGGMCYHPYLSSWNPNTSNLVGLADTLSKVFSQDPPVRAATSAQPQPPATPQPQPTAATTYPAQSTTYPPQTGYPYPQGQPATAQQGYPPQTGYPQGQPSPYQYGTQGQPYGQPQTGAYPYPPQQPTQPQPTFQNNQPFEDPSVVAKRNAVKSANERLQNKLQDFYSQNAKEIETFMNKNSQMEDRLAALELEKQRLAQMQMQTDTDLEAMTRSFEDITKWLQDHDTDAPLDIDVITEPADALTKQLLINVAEDATIEDALYYLEKKLGNGEMTLEQFLKTMRSLCADQFMKRATIKKIHEVRQVRVQ